MATYSNSRLSMYETCPFKYKLVYIDRVERPLEQSIEAFLGNKVHETLQKCYNDARYTKINTLESLIAHFELLWQKDWHDSIFITKPDLTREHYFELGKKMLAAYHQRYYPFDADSTMGTEMQLYFSLDKEKQYKMSGLVDRLARTKDGAFVIHDYKTSAYMPDQETADRDRQLGLYHIAVHQRWPDVENIKLVWHYLAFDAELVSFRAEDSINSLIESTKKLIDEIEAAKDFPPKESSLCGYCEYPEHCPRRKHITLVESLPLESYIKEPGVVLVNNFADLKRQQKNLNEQIEESRQRIIDYAKQEQVEVLKGNDCKVVIKFDTKLKLPRKGDADRKELETIIKESGKWMEVSDLDTNSLVKMIEQKKGDPELISKISKFGTYEESTIVRFLDETPGDDE